MDLVLAVRAASEQALHVAGGMDPQAVSSTLWNIAKPAVLGIEVELAACGR